MLQQGVQIGAGGWAPYPHTLTTAYTLCVRLQIRTTVNTIITAAIDGCQRSSQRQN